MKGPPFRNSVRNFYRTLAVCGVTLLTGIAAGQREDYLGPCVLVASKDSQTLYVANADARQLVWVDLSDGEILRRVSLPGSPTGVVLSPDGARLVVTCAAPASKIVVIDTVSGQSTATITAGHTTLAPAITPDGKRLYVCNRFNDDVAVIDLANGTEAARVEVVREPVVSAVTPDGNTVLVGNHLPKARTDTVFSAPAGAVITAIDTRTHATTGIPLPSGSHSVRRLCVSPHGELAYVTHILSNFEMVPNRVDQGWANINAISVIDVRKMKVVTTVGLDEMYLGAGNPWDVACTADGKQICVSHAGTHELSVIDASAALEKLLPIYVTQLAGAIPDGGRSGSDLRRRIRLPGKGPRGLAVVGSKVYVAEYFSDTLAVVDLQVAGDGQTSSIALGPTPHLTSRRQGQLLFNDAAICYHQWQSCASCHPDGRADALNWDLLNDGIGNFKNTKSLLLAHRTPPAMAEGVRPSAETAVRSGMEHILFADRPEDDAAAIDEYLKSLRPVPSPRLVKGRLSPAARRGERLFESNRVGCYKCHPAPLYTDLKKHNVGTRNRYEYVDRFDTPTLIEVWRTAPYLHDGRYTTVRELIVDGKHGTSRGRVGSLDEREIDDLNEFVLSL